MVQNVAYVIDRMSGIGQFFDAGGGANDAGLAVHAGLQTS